MGNNHKQYASELEGKSVDELDAIVGEPGSTESPQEERIEAVQAELGQLEGRSVTYAEAKQRLQDFDSETSIFNTEDDEDADGLDMDALLAAIFGNDDGFDEAAA